jgi:hypothetical protein
MTIKRVLLPLAGTDIPEPLAACAFRIGQSHQAQVRALVLQRQLLNVEFGDRAESADLLADLVAEAREERERAIAALAAPYRPLELDVSDRERRDRPAVAHAARLSDIAIVGAGARFGEGQWREIRDAALFQSGRPVIVAPRKGLEASAFDRVLIAWKESIEAARAVAAAQPFLRHAQRGAHPGGGGGRCGGGLAPGCRAVSAASLQRGAERGDPAGPAPDGPLGGLLSMATRPSSRNRVKLPSG